jgi:hypothetical protein
LTLTTLLVDSPASSEKWHSALVLTVLFVSSQRNYDQCISWSMDNLVGIATNRGIGRVKGYISTLQTGSGPTKTLIQHVFFFSSSTAFTEPWPPIF